MTQPLNNQADTAPAGKSLSAEGKIGLFLGIVAVVLAAVGFIPNWGRRVVAEFVVVLLLSSAIFWFEPQIKKFVKGIFPLLLIIILLTVSAELSYRLWYTPATTSPPPPINQPIGVARPGDEWDAWTSRMQNGIKKCVEDKSSPVAVVDVCIADAITKNGNYPKPDSSNSIDKLNADIRAGSVLMSIHEAFDLLDRKIGIKSNFLGDGLALPSDDQSYWKHRIPEYLVPQLLETNTDLWTWELPTTDSDRTLKDIIQAHPKNSLEGRNQKQFVENLERLISGPVDEPQVLVRVHRFPESLYKGSLGKPGSEQVFMLCLKDVYYMTFKEVAELSGHGKQNSNKSDRDRLWVWIYRPPERADVTVPTWGEIIKNIKNWVVK